MLKLESVLNELKGANSAHRTIFVETVVNKGSPVITSERRKWVGG